MRALLERSKSVRFAVAVLAAGCVLGLIHAAEAGSDLGLRRATFLPDELFGTFGLSTPSPVRATGERERGHLGTPEQKHHRLRRIWAAARGRPLRIALQRPRKFAASTKTPAGDASRRVRVAPSAEAFRLVPPPRRPALVSIYDDKTLRNGDAVMLQDGLHVFRDDGFWPHRPRDFVRLQFVAGLDWHLRRTLQPFDRNPPTRWTSIMMPPA